MTPAAEEPMAQVAPPEVPDFELIRCIGRGGFGAVWLASNRTTGRLRAVKVIPLESCRDGKPGKPRDRLPEAPGGPRRHGAPQLALDPSRGPDGRAFLLRHGPGRRRFRHGRLGRSGLPAGDAGAPLGRRAFARGGVLPSGAAASRRTLRPARCRGGPSRREAGELPVRRRRAEGCGLRAIGRVQSAGLPLGHAALHAGRRPDGRKGRRLRRRGW